MIADVFRSHDMGGWAKALWLIFVIILPFLGVFVYIIAHGNEMTRSMTWSVRRPRSRRSGATCSRPRERGGSADELVKLADLRDRGVITQAEFDQQKAKILT